MLFVSKSNPQALYAGSAHGPIGAYWAKALGTDQIKARQCSKRGGNLLLDVDLAGDCVLITGHTAVVSKGLLFLP